MATPSGSLRLRVILFLLRCRFWKSKPWRVPPMPSPSRPPGISILMASAPQSTSCRTQVGPALARVRSRTLNRVRGSAWLLVMAWRSYPTSPRPRRTDYPRRDDPSAAAPGPASRHLRRARALSAHRPLPRGVDDHHRLQARAGSLHHAVSPLVPPATDPQALPSAV